MPSEMHFRTGFWRHMGGSEKLLKSYYLASPVYESACRQRAHAPPWCRHSPDAQRNRKECGSERARSAMGGQGRDGDKGRWPLFGIWPEWLLRFKCYKREPAINDHQRRTWRYASSMARRTHRSGHRPRSCERVRRHHWNATECVSTQCEHRWAMLGGFFAATRPFETAKFKLRVGRPVGLKPPWRPRRRSASPGTRLETSETTERVIKR